MDMAHVHGDLHQWACHMMASGDRHHHRSCFKSGECNARCQKHGADSFGLHLHPQQGGGGGRPQRSLC